MDRTVSDVELHFALAQLNDLDRRIIKEFYGFGQSPSTDVLIGEGLAMDRQAVQRRRVNALGTLRSILEAQNV